MAREYTHLSLLSLLQDSGDYLKKQRELSDMSLRDAGAEAGLSHIHVKEIEDGVTAPSFDKVMRILQAYHADLQDFLRATGYLPKNRSPAALGKMRKIPVLSWVAAGRWTETGETFLLQEPRDDVMQKERLDPIDSY